MSSPSSACRPTTPSTAGCSPSSPTSGPDGSACPPSWPAAPGGVGQATPPTVRRTPMTWRRRCRTMVGMTTAHTTGAREQARTRHSPRRRRARRIMTASLALTGLACASGPTDAAALAAHTGTAAAVTPAHTLAAAASAHTLTAAAAARLADRVPTPVLRWTACRKADQCATAELPLDYNDPRGAKVKVALLRIRAKDPRDRLGTVFVNPGGPGDSARDWAALLPQALPKVILDRFDVVGADPRGVGGSTRIRCFATKAEKLRTLAPFTATPFPGTPAQQRSWIGAAQALGRACSTMGRPIAPAMDTTQDALDMDVLRRAVGDRKLTYFGESYGSYLGLVYANMFPGRVRAVAIDGIVGPQALAGTPATADVPLFDRMGSAAASYRALHELLELCQRAGRSRCSFADANTPARFAALAARLRAHPLRLAAPGVKATTFTYPKLITYTEQWLHLPSGYRGLFADLTDLARLTGPGGGGPAAPPWCGPCCAATLRCGPAPSTPSSKPSPVCCALTACTPRTPPRGPRPPLPPTAVPSTSGRSTPGSPSSARGTPGPRRTRTSTGARSIAAPPRPSW